MKVLIYGSIYKDQNKPYILELITTLDSLHIGYEVYAPYLENLVCQNIVSKDTGAVASYEEFKSQEFDYVITLGGDGTILSAATLIRDTTVPIIGINLGRLGFLSNIEKSLIRSAITAIYNGNYQKEERALIRVDSNIPVFADAPFALNDFTIHKRDTSSMITVHAYLDDVFLNSYWADGLILSTPTGSTGYNLSCGGPIIYPGSGNIVITPMAPHNLNVRPIILSDTSKVTFQVEGRENNFVSTLDRRYETISTDHKITISREKFNIHFVHPSDVDFLITLRQKLMWGLDKRN